MRNLASKLRLGSQSFFISLSGSAGGPIANEKPTPVMRILRPDPGDTYWSGFERLQAQIAGAFPS
jgi:hypothetical protein